MKVKVYFCKHCGHKEIVKDSNSLCPECFHYMSEEEWEYSEVDGFGFAWYDPNEGEVEKRELRG